MKKKSMPGSKISGYFGFISGTGSIISAHNVCHSICMAVVALFSVFGIAVSSTALMFLQEYNMLFWSMGVFFLVVSLMLYARFGKCISERMIAFNTGLLLAGAPFLTDAQLVFWIAGFSISLLILLEYIVPKIAEVTT